MENMHAGLAVRTLSNLIHRKINQMVAEEEETLTAHQMWVLKFLVNQEDREIMQRDIEREFSIRRSTASHMLTLMEHGGYIRRVPVPSDARMKRIVLTEKGRQAHERMGERIKRFETLLREGVTDQELEWFLGIIERLQQNIR
ncbi:MAG: MarR family transcriptional regulator [Hungatella sp.]|nr:MarR family transcriptional regulator [Hungatella sp.]